MFLKPLVYTFFLGQILVDYRYYDLALKRCCDNSASLSCSAMVNGTNAGSDVSEWSIHGLWPSYNKELWPQYCHSSVHFNQTQLAELEPEMNRYWPACRFDQRGYNPALNTTKANWRFWVHEYLKHGTCTGMDPYEYFRKTLDLFYHVRDKGLTRLFCDPRQDQCMIPFNLHFNSTKSYEFYYEPVEV